MTEIKGLSGNFNEAFKKATLDKKIQKDELGILEKSIQNTEDKKVFDLVSKDKSHISLQVKEGSAQANYEFDIDFGEDEKKDVSKLDTAFPESNQAQKYLNNISNKSFNQYFSPEVALTRFESEFRLPQKASVSSLSNVGNYTPLTPNYFIGLKSFNDLNNAIVKSYGDLVNTYNSSPSGTNKTNLQNQLNGLFKSTGTTTPTNLQIESYIKNNPDQATQIIGDMFANGYGGLTALTGDTNSYTSFNAPKWKGVCTDAHSAIAAIRTAMGQEAYVVNSSGNDSFHVFTVFKDKDNTFSIQNYGNVYKTSAKTLDELYDKAMPEQRFISAYKVSDDGNLTQAATKYRTATGLREEMFKGFSGTGIGDPFDSKESINVSNQGIIFDTNGAHIDYSGNEKKLGISYHETSNDITSKNVNGVAGQIRFEGQTPGLDAKYESETINDNGKSFGRTYWNVFNGLESTQTPSYWGSNVSAAGGGDPLVRIGGRYETNQSTLKDESTLKQESGYSWGVGGTINLDVSGKTKSFPVPIVATYGGQTYQDTVAYFNLNKGLLYKPNDNLTARVGVSSGFNFGNGRLDGLNNIGQQMINALDTKAYGDVRFAQGNFAANGLMNWHLNDPRQFEIGVGGAYSNENISAGAGYFVRQGVENIVDGLKISGSWKPSDNLSLNANAQTPVFGYNNAPSEINAGAEVKF